jgi:ATP-dependent Clp protease ATP-binding subunit ClpB
MTSNLGSQVIKELGGDYGKMEKEVRAILESHFKPEFLNRIDEIITFRPLTPDNIRRIADLQIGHLRQLLAGQKIALEVSPQAIAKLAEAGFDPHLGARPLRRVIQQELQDKLSVMILEGKLSPGATVHVDYKKDRYTFD